MRVFYVRPPREGGYGSGEGTSYDNAWNGFDAIDWSAMAGSESAMLRVCDSANANGRSLTVRLEWPSSDAPCGASQSRSLTA
jgi:hypothetical protein